MSQAPKFAFVRRQAKNHCNQFLVDSLQRLKTVADMRRLQTQSNCYWRIINSVCKYPIPIICQEQCLMLEGVGQKMSKVLKAMIHKQYAAFLIDSTGELEPQVDPFACDEKMEAVSNAGSQDQEQFQQPDSISFKKIHSVKNFKPKEKAQTQSDTQSMTSVCSGKYSIKEGSSASLFLRVLNSRPDQFWNKKQIKVALGQQQNISHWTFVKTLEKRRLVITQEKDGKIEYQITLLGQTELMAFEQKHKPASQLYNETLQRIQSKSECHSITKTIQRKYMDRGELQPFKVTLIIDNRQVKDKQSRQYFFDKLLNKYKVNCRVGVLSVGDFMWVLDSEKQGTFVLNYIIERKIADDLAASVMDGRYKHQKYRLKNCGIQNVYYMFEGHPSTNCAISETALETAIRKTQLKQRFKLIKTENTRETLVYISQMHKFVENKTNSANRIPIFGMFQRFNELNSKSFMTINDLTGLMLKSIPFVGKSTTLALVSKFGTMKQLHETLKPLERKQRIKLLDSVIKQTNKANHEAIARILIEILFVY